MRSALLLLLVLALVGLEIWTLMRQAPPPPPVTASASPSPPQPRRDDSDAARKARIGERLQAEVERLRRLRFLRPLPSETQSRREMQAFLKKELDAEDWPKEETVLRHFGLIPRDYRLREGIEALYGEQIAGYYDPRTRKFVMVEDRSSLTRIATFALNPTGRIHEREVMILHEMDHALTDQHFHLQTLQDRAKARKQNDAMLATMALIEGDATVLMLQAYNERVLGTSFVAVDPGALDRVLLITALLPFAGGEFSKAPPYLQKSMLFPYMAGAAFVDHHRQRTGWAGVASLYQDVPESSEQILHPEKYPHEKPVAITFHTPAAVPGWRLVDDNTLGEFPIRMRFEVAGRKDAAALAEGWAGDRYRVYQRDTRTFSIWHTEWDTEEDALEFERAAPGVVQRRGRSVVVLEGVPSELLDWARSTSR